MKKTLVLIMFILVTYFMNGCKKESFEDYQTKKLNEASSIFNNLDTTCYDDLTFKSLNLIKYQVSSDIIYSTNKNDVDKAFNEFNTKLNTLKKENYDVKKLDFDIIKTNKIDTLLDDDKNYLFKSKEDLNKVYTDLKEFDDLFFDEFALVTLSYNNYYASDFSIIDIMILDNSLVINANLLYPVVINLIPLKVRQDSSYQILIKIKQSDVQNITNISLREYDSSFINLIGMEYVSHPNFEY